MVPSILWTCGCITSISVSIFTWLSPFPFLFEIPLCLSLIRILAIRFGAHLDIPQWSHLEILYTYICKDIFSLFGQIYICQGSVHGHTFCFVKGVGTIQLTTDHDLSILILVSSFFFFLMPVKLKHYLFGEISSFMGSKSNGQNWCFVYLNWLKCIQISIEKALTKQLISLLLQHLSKKYLTVLIIWNIILGFNHFTCFSQWNFELCDGWIIFSSPYRQHFCVQLTIHEWFWFKVFHFVQYIIISWINM